MKSIPIIKCDEGKIIITIPANFEASENIHYDTMKEANIEIRSGNYSVIGSLWISFEDFKLFYDELLEAHKQCKGVATLINYEGTLELKIEYKTRGLIEVKGGFKEYHSKDNELMFHIEADQTYLNDLLDTLKQCFN